MTRPAKLLATAVVLVLLSGLVAVGARAVNDLHTTRVRLDQQQRGQGAMPDLQRTQISLAREQLAVARDQLAVSRKMLALAEHTSATADATLAEVRRTRALAGLILSLERRIAELVATINRKQYQPPAPSSPSR